MNRYHDTARDLGAIIGPDWQGWTWNDGQIFAPEWRRGLTPAEIRAIPYLRALEADGRRKREKHRQEVRMLRAAAELATRRAEFYRRQVRLEATLGLALQRILT
jgi:hypothetical protein